MAHVSGDSTLVQTLYGPVRGSCANTKLGADGIDEERAIPVLSWLGVPFAQPPVGPLRFMAPVWPEIWTEVRNTTEYQPICIQSGDEGISGHSSEDCLYLNIFAPVTKPGSEPLPVYIYIHGGGFTGGSSASFKPMSIVALSNIIVVTISYRLGPFGFMHLPEVGINGNMGFLDQNLAMKWVNENIRRFNGDPSKVTLGKVFFLFSHNSK
jgi:para-nitrobenzyl esterase